MAKTYDWIDPSLKDSHQQSKRQRIKAIAKLIEKRGRVNRRRFLAEMEIYGITYAKSNILPKAIRTQNPIIQYPSLHAFQVGQGCFA